MPTSRERPATVGAVPISYFYKRFPTGRVVTRFMREYGGAVVFRACVYRFEWDRGPAATGWSMVFSLFEGARSPTVVERAESLAIARALANLGIGVDEEVDGAGTSVPAHMIPSSQVALRSLGTPSHPTDSHRGPGPAACAVDASRLSPPMPPDAAAHVPLSPIARDVRRLTMEAAGLGMRPYRVLNWIKQVEEGHWGSAELERIEVWLRGWVLRAREARLAAESTAAGGLAFGR